MLTINFPQYNFKIKKERQKPFIFDEVRRRWVTVTPEEWVRQNFLQYLIQVKNYPPSLISVEKLIRVGELKKRYDIVVYRESRPWLIVECKEANTPLDTLVIEQVLHYNIALGIRFFVITNGKLTYAYELLPDTFIELTELPIL